VAPFTLIGADKCLSLATIAAKCPPGCFVEVGVYQGGSAWLLSWLAERQGRDLYLYDTFAGIPHKDELDVHQVGDFADCSFEAVCEAIPSATVVMGVFPDSAVPMPPVAFAHIDCDQYKSVSDSLAFLRPLMVQGGAIVLDDVWCLEGATKALLDSHLPFGETDCGKAIVRF
jgi:O-methyltransferase